LTVVNALSEQGTGPLNASFSEDLPMAHRVDVNADGRLTPMDVLMVINHIHSPGVVAAEGETGGTVQAGRLSSTLAAWPVTDGGEVRKAWMPARADTIRGRVVAELDTEEFAVPAALEKLIDDFVVDITEALDAARTGDASLETR
jgi:hypothetical protein